MKSYINIDKHPHKKGLYVGYADGVWYIQKSNSSYGNWWAYKRDASNIQFNAHTLTVMSEKLLTYNAMKQKEREIKLMDNLALSSPLTDKSLPYNPVTGSQYTNNNMVLLACLTTYTSPEWAGYKQWLKVGRIVRKGEKGTRILIVKTKKLQDKKGQDVYKPYPSSVFVFNINQTDVMTNETQPQTSEAKNVF